MPKLVKNSEIIYNDPWKLWEESPVDTATISHDHWILPLEDFLTLAKANAIDYKRHGVWLKADDDAELLGPHRKELQLIALRFIAFMDGRSFSQARALREHFDYEGEIRALGYFIPDQLYYLNRCGVDAYEVNDELPIEQIKSALSEFSERYQAACDEAQPLFRRRV